MEQSESTCSVSSPLTTFGDLHCASNWSTPISSPGCSLSPGEGGTSYYLVEPLLRPLRRLCYVESNKKKRAGGSLLDCEVTA